MQESSCMVSILCTAYNHSAYIAQTLESFLMQETNFPFEILVSDDASTDDTADIIRRYEEQNPDVVRPVYLKENLYSQGRNLYAEVLFPRVRGKYICICEGDDYWIDPTKLQRQVDFLEAHPDYSACVHNTVLHYCDGSQPDRLLLHDGRDTDLGMERVLSGASRTYHTSSLMGRAHILTDMQDFYHVAFRCGGFTDYPNNIWLLLNGKIRYLDRPMSVYRINSNPSAWSSGVDSQYKKLRRFVYSQREMLKAVLPHMPPEYREMTEQAILEREFELMYLEGRDREQRRPPYDAILKQQPLSYRAKNLVKCCFPAIQRWHRKRRGFD